MKKRKTPIAPHVGLIGDRLRAIRQDRDLTQTSLLEQLKQESVRLRLLGVFSSKPSSYNICHYIEGGLREPSFTEAILLCQILDVPPESLLPYWIRGHINYPYAQRHAYPVELAALRNIAFSLTGPQSPQQTELKNALLRLSRDYCSAPTPIC